jgi:prolyl-tRNA editing enzyme YbaK/EbsC (Cys-tRNA(Pro) deacylase)
VTHPLTPIPTTLSPADVSALSPGAKALLMDYRSHKLSAYSFCGYVLGAFMPLGTIPVRYRDVVLTQKDKIALVVTMQGAQTKLTPQQTAQLTSHLIRAVADH